MLLFQEKSRGFQASCKQQAKDDLVERDVTELALPKGHESAEPVAKNLQMPLKQKEQDGKV